MKRSVFSLLSFIFCLAAVTNGYAQSQLSASLSRAMSVKTTPSNLTGTAPVRTVPASGKKEIPAGTSRADLLTKYEQTCALRFFEFCDYLQTPPDIIIDSSSYSAGEKKDEIVMQRERAEDTAKIKKAVLRYTVVPVPTITSDSLHFSQEEMSDQGYRNLESAFTTMEKLLDSCYNLGGAPLKLVPLRLHDNVSIRKQIGPGQRSRTFLLQRGRQTLAVLVFTPQNNMTPTRPPRICGWSVDFRHGRMVFHNISELG